MGLVTTNKLNKFWKSGILPIKNALAGTLNKAKVLNTREEIMANTSSEYAAGALVVKELNNNLPQFIYDEDGKITGYKTAGGADAVFPFTKGSTKYKITITQFWNGGDQHCASCSIADENGNAIFSGSSGWMSRSSQGSKSYDIEL